MCICFFRVDSSQLHFYRLNLQLVLQTEMCGMWLDNKLKRYLKLVFLLDPLYLEVFCSYRLFLDTTANSHDTCDYMGLFSGRVPA